MNPFLNLWHYLKGTAHIKIIGECPAYFLNDLAADRIPFWDVVPRKNGYTLSVYARDVTKTQNRTDRAGVDLTVQRFSGLPVRTAAYRHRYGILIGIALFALLLSTLSGRLWGLTIVGVPPETQRRILAALEKQGVTQGMDMDRVPIDLLKQSLPLELPELAWISCNRQGSTLLISASLATDGQTPADDAPCNLVASEDGVIESVQIERGISAVAPGQTVAKDQLLASGVAARGGVNVFTVARGTVMATVKRPFETDINKEQTLTQPIKAPYDQTVLKLYGCTIPLFLGNETRAHTKEVTGKTMTLWGRPLPFSLYTRRITLTQTQTVPIDPNDLECRIADQLKTELKTNDLSLESLQIIDTGEVYHATGYVVLTKNIAKCENIKIYSENRD